MKWIRRLGVVAMLAFLTVSCSDSPTEPQIDVRAISARLGEPFSVPVSETAIVQPPGLSVTFLRVDQDSRCPTDVTCVWEGEGLLDLRLRLRDSARDVQVSTHLSSRNSVLFEGLSLRVIGLEPSPHSSDGPIGSRPYRATLIVEVP